MNLLTQLAEQTWLRLDELLLDLDYTGNERQLFVDETKVFFEERLLIYEKQRNQLEETSKTLRDELNRLADELGLDRSQFNTQPNSSIKQKQEFLRKEIDRLKILLNERNKELVQLRQIIGLKVKIIGNVAANPDEVRF